MELMSYMYTYIKVLMLMEITNLQRQHLHKRRKELILPADYLDNLISYQ